MLVEFVIVLVAVHEAMYFYDQTALRIMDSNSDL